MLKIVLDRFASRTAESLKFKDAGGGRFAKLILAMVQRISLSFQNVERMQKKLANLLYHHLSLPDHLRILWTFGSRRLCIT